MAMVCPYPHNTNISGCKDGKNAKKLPHTLFLFWGGFSFIVGQCNSSKLNDGCEQSLDFLNVVAAEIASDQYVLE